MSLLGRAASAIEEQWSLLRVDLSEYQFKLRRAGQAPAFKNATLKLIVCANSTENAVLGMKKRTEFKAKLLISYEIPKGLVSTNSEEHLTDLGYIQSS